MNALSKSSRHVLKSTIDSRLPVVWVSCVAVESVRVGCGQRAYVVCAWLRRMLTLP